LEIYTVYMLGIIGTERKGAFMKTYKKGIYKTDVYISRRKYSIVDTQGNTMYPEIHIAFFTQDGYFAALLPETKTVDEFKKYIGCELYELPVEDEAVYRAGIIEKCTSSGIYGRIFKNCIHREIEGWEYLFNIWSSGRIEEGQVSVWSHAPWCSNKRSIDSGHITDLPNKQKRFSFEINDPDENLIGAVIIQKFRIIGIATRLEGRESNTVRCICAEVLLKEMCNYIEEYKAAVVQGFIEEEKEPEFIIRGGVLEKYQGDSEVVVVPDEVHTIGVKAFFDNWVVKSVHLPESIKRIELKAFDSCLQLERINFPENLEYIGSDAFQLCRSLKSIELPYSVTQIGSGAFYHCDNLISIKLPQNLSIIERSLFGNCKKLTSIVIPEAVEKIEDHAFSGCKKLLDIKVSDYTRVEFDVFNDTPWFKNYLRKNDALISGNKVLAVNEKLKKYEIPDNIECIGKFAFCKSNIEELVIPSSVKQIESYAFSLSKIKRIHLPEELETIGDSAFENCVNLEELIIPKNVNEIGSCALYKLPNCIVTILNDKEDAELIDEDSFGRGERSACVKEVRAYYGSKAMRVARLWNLPCTYLENTPRKYTYINEDFCCLGTTLVRYLGHNKVVIVPEGITIIGDYAFKKNYSGAEKVILPSSVQIIGKGAFANSDSLKEIEGVGVIEIESIAFFNAINLEKVYFPSLEKIAEDAFERCCLLTGENIIIPNNVKIDF